MDFTPHELPAVDDRDLETSEKLCTRTQLTVGTLAYVRSWEIYHTLSWGHHCSSISCTTPRNLVILQVIPFTRNATLMCISNHDLVIKGCVYCCDCLLADKPSGIELVAPK